MKIYRLNWPRKISTRRLAKYVSVCLAVSCILFVACHMSLTTTWRPFLLVSSDGENSQRYVSRRGKSGLSAKFDRSLVYKPEWVQFVRNRPQVMNKPREKWQIMFITDDTDLSLTARMSERRLQTQKETGNQNAVGSISGKRISLQHIPPANYTSKLKSVSGPYKLVGSSPASIPSSKPRQRTILLWTTFFGKSDWLPDEKLENCSISGWPTTGGVKPCRISSDKSELNISDLIIMHANDLNSSLYLPSVRTANQRWLFYCQESPKHMYLDLSNFSGVFNYTWLTRRDADYVFRHGEVVPKEVPVKLKKFRRKISAIMELKQRLAVARISNCEPRERLEYIKELRKFIKVDFFGACGDKTCPKTDESCNGSKMTTYKFYLAFENSRCKDYITEKFWLPLHHWNSVPVVMGGAGPGDYRDVAPPHSYINTADFHSPRELAKYLLLLDRNQTMYEEYFRWRRFYGNRRQKDHTWCKVCADLHDSSKPSQYYTDLKGWYRQDSCV